MNCKGCGRSLHGGAFPWCGWCDWAYSLTRAWWLDHQERLTRPADPRIVGTF